MLMFFNKFSLFTITAIILSTLIACSNNNVNHLASTSLISNNLPLPTPSIQQLSKAATINVKLGLYYLQQQDFQRAKTKLLLALAQTPRNILAYDAFGYFLEIGENNPAAAEKYYQQALTLALHEDKSRLSQEQSGNLGQAYNNYGAFLYRQQRCTEALTQFNLALSDPNYLNVTTASANAKLAAQCNVNHHLVHQIQA